MKWPYFEIEFKDHGRITVASIGIGSALIEALGVVNANRVLVNGIEPPELRMSDVLSVRQLGDIHIPEQAQDEVETHLRSV